MSTPRKRVFDFKNIPSDDDDLDISARSDNDAEVKKSPVYNPSYMPAEGEELDIAKIKTIFNDQIAILNEEKQDVETYIKAIEACNHLSFDAQGRKVLDEFDHAKLNESVKNLALRNANFAKELPELNKKFALDFSNDDLNKIARHHKPKSTTATILPPLVNAPAKKLRSLSDTDLEQIQKSKMKPHSVTQPTASSIGKWRKPENATANIKLPKLPAAEKPKRKKTM